MSEKINIPVADRSLWASGPWDSESDYESWRSPEGFPCVMRRGGGGAWCGYVGVPEGHPWHGKDFSMFDTDVAGISVLPECHGGVTYSDSCNPEMGVCHVSEPGESDNFWWIGFDCAHWSDEVPERIMGLTGGRYRDASYVRKECEKLAGLARAAA